MDWFDRAERRIEKEYENDEITHKEYVEQMRDLNDEYEQAKQVAAQHAYDNY